MKEQPRCRYFIFNDEETNFHTDNSSIENNIEDPDNFIEEIKTGITEDLNECAVTDADTDSDL